jgi:acid phosphatase (class A)
LFPDRAATIIRRGIEYGDERVVCRVHFPSAVRAAQTLAAATFARLWSDPEFQQDWASTQREVSALSAISPCTD